jgi:putative transposase
MHVIGETTYYAWKSKYAGLKYAGLEVSQLRHLKDVESELSRLKRMYADLVLEHHAP